MEINIEGRESIKVTQEKDTIQVNGEDFQWDMLKLSDRAYHLIYQNQSYEVEVVEADYEQKTFRLKINDKLVELNAKDRFDLLLEEMGMSDLASQKISDVKAPMPGLIFDILVKPGDPIEKGQKVLILEAMKMENVIKSPTDAVVKEVKIKKGQNVEKNQILLELE